MSSLKIMVCCHKKTPLLKDEVFTPILLGSAFADKSLKETFAQDIWDNMGENIAQLHPYCAELTAIYWAWKNYDALGNPDYLGLFHYRRFFNFSDPLGEKDLWRNSFFDFNLESKCRFGWNAGTIEHFCADYDLILPEHEEILDPYDWRTPATLETHYKHSHYPEDFDLAMNFICEQHPEYHQAVEMTRSSMTGYFCNMFVMKRELFFNYAQWLFSVIFPLKDLLPVTSEKYNGEKTDQKRVLGFLCERLFNVWIMYQKQTGRIRIGETERITGYLSESDQDIYKKQYGQDAYDMAVSRSHRVPSLAQRGIGDGPEIIVHPARNETTPAVSILLPVYNVAPYLRECIESLIHQTLTDIELIFVNDASPDDSMDILMEYYDNDPRICVIEHIRNGGMPRARNTAIPFAHGKYIAFLDSDDICDLTMFEKLYRKAEELSADIVSCSVWGFIDTLDNLYLHRPLEWYGNSDKALPLAQRPQMLMEPAAWCKLFRTDFIRSLDFFEFRPGTLAWEDVPAMTSAFSQASRIATVQEALYFYRQRSQGNLSASMNKRKVTEFISGAIMQKQILDKHGPDDWEFCSYIEEFKCLYAEWMFSKLERKAKPYFFHNVPRLFKWKDRRYLKRLFDLYPKRKLFYYVLMTRSCLLYWGGKVLWKTAKGVKKAIKKVFGIHRDGIYWAFRIGPAKFKLLKKAYCTETIQYLESRASAAYGQLEEYSHTQVTLQQQTQALQWRLDESRSSIEVLAQAVEEKEKALTQARQDINESRSTIEALVRTVEEKEKTLTQAQRLIDNQNIFLDNCHTILAERNSTVDRCMAALNENSGILDGLRQELSEKSETLRAMQAEAGGFYHAVWTTGWVDYWKHYFFENYHTISEKTKLLKQSLDDESCCVIDRLCYRNFYLLPLQKDSKFFLYDHGSIYTDEELRGAGEPLNEDIITQQYMIPRNVNLEIPVFRFHCGLKVLPQQVLNRIVDRDVIDGGAYWGDSALIFSEYKPHRIFAFEPHPESFEKLKDTIRMNHLSDSVIPVQAGIGNRQGNQKLYTNGMASGSSLTDITPTVYGEGRQTNVVEIVTIDDWTAKNELDVGMIKLDIEGNELAAIKGAINTIKRCKPLLSIAIYHQPQDFFEIKPMLESLNLGYHFLIRKLVYHDLVTEVVLLGYPKEETAQ